MANVSAWVDGCPIGPSGLPISMTATWDSVDVCGSVVWGICVVGILASAVVRSWFLAAWGGSSIRGSLASLFLGGI
jgi:hypothetical protein